MAIDRETEMFWQGTWQASPSCIPAFLIQNLSKPTHCMGGCPRMESVGFGGALLSDVDQTQRFAVLIQQDLP